MKVEEGPRLIAWWCKAQALRSMCLSFRSQVLATAEIGAGKSKKDSEAAKQWSQKEESRMPFYGV